MKYGGNFDSADPSRSLEPLDSANYPVIATGRPGLCGAYPSQMWCRVGCCVEAECHFCYLEESGLYVHESCCPGNQRHLPTYVECRRFWYGPLTKYGS
jgi:hypothetical protein